MHQEVHSFAFLEGDHHIWGLLLGFSHELCHDEGLWQLPDDLIKD